MKPRIIKALATALGLYGLGLSYWLHSIDEAKVVMTFKQSVINPGWLGPTMMPPPSKVEVIPPPWYASLWPEALALGIALLFLSWAKEMPSAARVAFRAIKVAYRKWEEWDSGGRRFP